MEIQNRCCLELCTLTKLLHLHTHKKSCVEDSKSLPQFKSLQPSFQLSVPNMISFRDFYSFVPMSCPSLFRQKYPPPPPLPTSLPRGYSWKFLQGVWHPFLQTLTLFQTKKYFSHLFPDLVSEKLCHHYLDFKNNNKDFLKSISNSIIFSFFLIHLELK